MVSKRVRLVLLLGGIGLIIAYFVIFNDGYRVKRVIKNTAALLNKETDEQKLILAARSNKLKPYLAKEFVVDIPAYRFQGTYTREDVATRALAVFYRAKSIAVQLYDLEVEIISDVQAAAMFTAEIFVQIPGRDPVRDYIQLACSLEKVSGEWVISQVEVVQTLEK